MDSDGSSARQSNYSGGGEATVSSFITFIILLAGVLGGLIIVIVVILFCKYCLKGKKPSRRSLRDGSGEAGRAVRVLQRYETINSDVFSEPSSASLDGIPLSPRKPLDLRVRGQRDVGEEVNERTHLRSSYDKENVLTHQAEEGVLVLEDNGGSSPAAAAARGSVAGDHVTLEGATAIVKDEDEVDSERRRSSERLPQGVEGAGGGNFKRYTEGDFHYLKYAKIGSLPRQASLLEAPPPSASLPQGPTPSLAAIVASDVSFRYSLDERLRLLQWEAEKSFPPIRPPSPVISQQPGARAGSSRDGTLAVSPEPELGAAARLSPSPPRSVREPERWRRRTPSASPSPPGEPVHRRVNVEVHYQQEGEAQDSGLLPQQDGAVEQPRVPPADSRTGDQPQQRTPPTDTETTTTTTTTVTTATPTTATDPSQDPTLDGQAASSSGNGVGGAIVRPDLVKQHSVPPLKHGQRAQSFQKKTSHSHSLELTGSRRRAMYPSTRRVKSYDDVAPDYDVLQITEFSRGPFYNTDYDIISEMASPTSSKVRYNDTGSLEDLQEVPGDEDTTSCLALEALLPSNSCSPGDQPRESHEPPQPPQHHPPQQHPADTLDVSLLNRQLWQLRATLEEEEECSDTIRMEDCPSPEDSPDHEHAPDAGFVEPAVVVAQVSSGGNGEEGGEEEEAEVGGGPHHLPHPPHPPPSSQSGCGERDGGGGCVGNDGQLLHPNYEKRRQTYKNQLNGRQAKPSGDATSGLGHGTGSQGQGSANNSFDSVETDGEVSDTSRQEVTTTSFESTTDNTDSTTESQHSRLRQMKTDSGYKSLETQQSGVRDIGEVLEVMELPLDEHPEMERLQLQDAPGAVQGHRQGDGEGSGDGGRGRGSHSPSTYGRIEVAGGRRNSNAVHFERRAGRTASKKRREYSRERQVIHVYESVLEPEEGDTTQLELHSSDAQRHPHPTAPPPTTTKRSVFTRFFSHGSSRDPRDKYMVRDYSIDEKTNEIFNEFLRQESPTDTCSTGRGEGGARLGGLRRSPRSQHRPARLQRKHTDPLFRMEGERRGDRLAPEMRSVSLGSDSSAGSVRRLSPQDSIEEEEFEEEEEEEGEREAEGGWTRPGGLEKGESQVTEPEGKVAVLPTPSLVQDIPIIKLPEEEAQDAS